MHIFNIQIAFSGYRKWENFFSFNKYLKWNLDTRNWLKIVSFSYSTIFFVADQVFLIDNRKFLEYFL